MADIVIHGMDVPKLCCECPLKESMYDVGYICLPRKEPIKVNLYKGIDDACPLLPLPEGHGRLIDADALKKYWQECEEKLGPKNTLGLLTYHDVLSEAVIYDLDNAPTIVPAEGDDKE